MVIANFRELCIMKWLIAFFVCFGFYKIFISKNKLFVIDERGKLNGEIPLFIFFLLAAAFLAGTVFGEEAENERIFKSCTCKNHRCVCDFELQAEIDETENEIAESRSLGR